MKTDLVRNRNNNAEEIVERHRMINGTVLTLDVDNIGSEG
jgi:hypothetical protein